MQKVVGNSTGKKEVRLHRAFISETFIFKSVYSEVPSVLFEPLNDES